jgi:hypothetical protein
MHVERVFGLLNDYNSTLRKLLFDYLFDVVTGQAILGNVWRQIFYDNLDCREPSEARALKSVSCRMPLRGAFHLPQKNDKH